MKKKYTKLIIVILCNTIFANSLGSYESIANELLVRKKLYNKLPDIFDNNKFLNIVSALDNLANIEIKTHSNRLTKDDPSFHWCFAQAYLLAGMSIESIDHYRKFKIQTLSKGDNLNPIFQNQVTELEIALENGQALLAYKIHKIINDFKNKTNQPLTSQIIDLQNKLNTYNELILLSESIQNDGVLGPETKIAIYDFEKNNPYFIDIDEIENTKPRQSTPYPSSDSFIRAVSNTDNENQKVLLEKTIKLTTKIIIDSEKIESIPGNSVAEILEHIAGLNVNRSGVSDALANISTFGGTSEQTLILIDGLKFSNQQSLNNDFDLPINLDDIEQIEISRSPNGRHYGSGAISGIINIITKDASKRKTYLSTELGNFAHMNGNLSINLPIGKSFHNISFSDTYSDGYMQNTDYIKRTFYYKYAITDGKSTTNFSFGYLTRGNGINNHLSNLSQYQNQYQNNTTKFFNSKILWNFADVKLESNMHWFDYNNELAINRDKGNWNKKNSSEIGISFNFIKQSSNALKTTRITSFSYNRETNSNGLYKEIQRDHYLLGNQYDFIINNLNLNLGFSTNYYNDFGWYLSPGYQVVFNLNNNANIYHKYDRGFRLPSFYEMYADDYLNTGNLKLEGESSNLYEFGIEIYGSAMKMNISQFYKENQNTIDWFSTLSGNQKTWTSTNISDVLVSGNNLNIEIYPEIIKFISFIKRLELAYSHLDIENNGIEENYRFLSNYLKHQMTFGMQYKLPFGISRSWYVRYEQPTAYDNRTIIDTQIHAKIWRFETILNISNIFDVNYEDIEDITLPGRWVKFNIKYNLN